METERQSREKRNKQRMRLTAKKLGRMQLLPFCGAPEQLEGPSFCSARGVRTNSSRGRHWLSGQNQPLHNAVDISNRPYGSCLEQYLALTLAQLTVVE